MDATSFITRESDRFASVLASLDPITPCPSCPGWTARDLIAHLTQVHHFWATVLAEDIRSDEDASRIDDSPPELPESIDEILPVRAAATRALTAALDNLDDAEPRWTWWPSDQTVGFTRKMQVCEAVMHRVDAELAAGLDPSPIDRDVAAHCLSHCVNVMWGWLPDGASHTSRGIVRIASDGQEWFIDVGDYPGTGGEPIPRAQRAAAGAEPTVEIAGDLEELARWAWGRGGQVMITGDKTGVAAMEGLIAAGIQ